MRCFSLRRGAAGAVLSVAFGATGMAVAQVPAAPPLSDAERAKRDAEKVFQWIRIHADKPRKVVPPPGADKAAERPAERATVQAAKPAPRPARPAEKPAEPAAEATARTTPAAPAPQTAAAPATAPAPAATVAVPTVDASAPIAAAPAVDDDDIVLTPVLKTEPQFPGHLMRQLRKGQVQVAFTVQPDGSVGEVQAVSSTHPRLAPVAVATVAQWRFQPVRAAQPAVVDLGFNLD